MATKTKANPTNGQAKAASNGTASPAAQTPAASRIAVWKTYKIFIGGAFPRTESGRYYPLTLQNGQVVNVCLSSRKDFRNAMVAARDAAHKWASRAAFNRSQILYRMAEMLETRAAQFREELVWLGHTEAEARAEVSAAVDRLIYYAGWCDKFQQVFSAVNPVSSSHFNFSAIEPVGVVAAVAPEDSALLGLVSAIAPIIAGGNTCVVLASESKALCAVTLAEVLSTSDLPGGVVNILTGNLKELMVHMAGHMDVNAMYLNTADGAAQKQAGEESARNVKRLFTEGPRNWFEASEQSPYRILDYTEVKTTWHPIGI
jgi:acyl-CoA reductase-like NAD-dependent aldehyde dehydrogenase